MKIIIDRQRIFARHGVLPQEREVGAYFEVSLEVTTSAEESALSDELSDTISYADLSAIVTREMDIPSQLLEHVAGRIGRSILAANDSIEHVRVRIMKENPPMGIECQGAGIELDCWP